MTERRPIDRKRESGGALDVGTKEDGAIVELMKIGSRLIAIKERAIYEIIRADDVDPNRTNIGIPTNFSKLIVDQGAESELVSRVFLTAKGLFKPEFIKEDIDTSVALMLTLDLLHNIFSLQHEINDYLSEEERVATQYEKDKANPTSYNIPSIPNTETRLNTMLHKAYHAEQVLMELISIFFPNKGITKQSHFVTFHNLLIEEFGAEDTLTVEIGKTVEYMTVLRNLRDALDHRLKSVKVKDYELQPNSDVLSPTLELNFRKTNIERMPISEFVNTIVPNLIFISELVIAGISSKNSRTGMMVGQVRWIPEERRRHKFVNYAFWIPLGDGGFFQQ